MVCDLYTDKEWCDIRNKINRSRIDGLDCRRFYAFPGEHKKIYLEFLINRMSTYDNTPIAKDLRDLYEALYGDLCNVPMYINSQPGIVRWRLIYGK